MKSSKIRLTILAIFSCLTIVLSGCSTMLNPKATPATITIEELENRMDHAMDPLKIYRNADSYVQEAICELSIWFTTQDIKVRTFYKHDGSETGKIRVDYFLDNKIITSMIYMNDSAYIVNFRNKTIQELSEQDYHNMVTFAKLFQPDATYADTFSKIEIFECQLEDRNYYWLKCYFNENDKHPYEVFVDAETYLTKRIQIVSKEVGEYTATIDRYATYSNVTVPDIFTTVSGNITQNYDLTLYNIDIDIPDSRFALPEDFKTIKK